jgi:hypothetical protein
MVTFHWFRSAGVKPLEWIKRICLRTVDLPDSPAPERDDQHMSFAVIGSQRVIVRGDTHQATTA